MIFVSLHDIVGRCHYNRLELVYVKKETSSSYSYD